MQLNILNYYEDRIPKVLRDLTKLYLKKYNLKCIKYTDQINKKSRYPIFNTWKIFI